ncbi:MAG: hypothetical protein ISS48_04950 [Candidatus Aenigmarchaeota archaeon]|nr:hypothetical protein [Candidatus Aenigmarchaeota archaeon]
MKLTPDKGGLIIALIGAFLIAIDGSFWNINIRGLGVGLLIIGVIVYLSKSKC